MNLGRNMRLLAPVALAVMFLPACRTSRAPGGAFPEQKLVAIEVVVGRVLRVSPEHGYVVLQCASLPLTGEEAKVYRDEQGVGRLRISGPINMPFAIADILEGTPEAGDFARVMRTRPVETTDGSVQ